MTCTFSWRRQWHPTPVLLPGKFHGQRSLVGCSPWGREESDMTENPHFHFSLSCIGEGNDNPFQCSCLENSRDGGAWWAAVYGVTQSRIRLKWLSSSSAFSWQNSICLCPALFCIPRPNLPVTLCISCHPSFVIQMLWWKEHFFFFFAVSSRRSCRSSQNHSTSSSSPLVVEA